MSNRAVSNEAQGDTMQRTEHPHRAAVGEPSQTIQGQAYIPEYGDLTGLNSCRVILDGVGREALVDIASDFLDLLDTSSAVYEKNGDYALGILSSSWCRFLDSASRGACLTDDNVTALACGQWHCHESCWHEASKVAIEKGEPVDIECRGGIRLYAIPISAGEEIIGSINLGYGDPPRALPKLQDIAKRYRVELGQLIDRSEIYETRPPYVIDIAKKRLTIAAKRIGEIVRRQNAERALRATEQSFLLLAEHSPDVFWMRAPGGGSMFYVNRAYETIWGRSRDRLYAEPKSFADAIHPEDRDRVTTETNRHAAGSWDIEYRIVRPDGEERWIHDCGFPVCDEGGNLVRMCGVARDVTQRRRDQEHVCQVQKHMIARQRDEKERVNAELASVRDKLVWKTRLATIGKLAASIAHDLRNPLGAVRNAAFYLKRHLAKEPPELIEFLQIIEDEVAGADRIIDNLLEMARSHPPCKRDVALADLAERAMRRIETGKKIRFRISSVPDPFHIQADPDQLLRVFDNLFENALAAMEENGKLVVAAHRTEKHDVIVVHNTGRSIPANLRKKVFDPLVTTKVKGTGLGLTICRELIEGHGGTMQVMDDVRPGAAFRIRLPHEEPWKPAG